jgi:hypothetical protein
LQEVDEPVPASGGFNRDAGIWGEAGKEPPNTRQIEVAELFFFYDVTVGVHDRDKRKLLMEVNTDIIAHRLSPFWVPSLGW